MPFIVVVWATTITEDNWQPTFASVTLHLLCFFRAHLLWLTQFLRSNRLQPSVAGLRASLVPQVTLHICVLIHLVLILQAQLSKNITISPESRHQVPYHPAALIPKLHKEHWNLRNFEHSDLLTTSLGKTKELSFPTIKCPWDTKATKECGCYSTIQQTVYIWYMLL